MLIFFNLNPVTLIIPSKYKQHEKLLGNSRSHSCIILN